MSGTYSTAMLDFGPASVDGWSSRPVAAELGVHANEMLDVEARELVLDDSRVRFTQLEFAVFRYLRKRESGGTRSFNSGRLGPQVRRGQ